MLNDEGVFYEKTNITLEDCEKWFSNIDLSDTKIKACGVLGDPIANPELYEILWFFLFDKNIRDLEISTNGGLRSTKWWAEMGLMSKMSEKRMNVHWSVDGATRNDYREGVYLPKVLHNMKSYCENGGKGIWQFIRFDYNKNEESQAREMAKELGMGFASRNSWRNNADHVKFKSTDAKEIDSDKYEIVQQRAYSGDYDNPNIKCRHLEKDEWFISASGELWPCCHLHDENVGSYTKHHTAKLGKFNSLHDKSLLDIKANPWYNGTLQESWNKDHPLHQPRCYLSCGDKGKRSVRKNIEL